MTRTSARWSSTLPRPRLCAASSICTESSAVCAGSSKKPTALGCGQNATRRRMAPSRPFSRGHLYGLLANPIYTGQIAHKGELYPGQHPALIDNETWTAVRNQLAANTSDHRHRARAAEPSLLAGLLV